MIAQRTKTNDEVVTSDEATVQAAVKLLTQIQAVEVYRWSCEVCGMIHTGSMPTSCESCGSVVTFTHQPDCRREINSRW